MILFRYYQPGEGVRAYSIFDKGATNVNELLIFLIELLCALSPHPQTQCHVNLESVGSLGSGRFMRDCRVSPQFAIWLPLIEFEAGSPSLQVRIDAVQQEMLEVFELVVEDYSSLIALLE